MHVPSASATSQHSRVRYNQSIYARGYVELYTENQLWQVNKGGCTVLRSIVGSDQYKPPGVGVVQCIPVTSQLLCARQT